MLVKLLVPFTPHFCEELWEQLGEEYSVFNQPYPVCDESALVLDTIEMPLQINGKVRSLQRPHRRQRRGYRKTDHGNPGAQGIFRRQNR